MRAIFLLCFLAMVTLSLAQEKNEAEKKDVEKKDEEKYTDRFDNVDVDELIANRRLLVPYIRCVLDMGRCTPEGKELKAHVKDAMQTACKKCTDKQKSGARLVVNHIKNKEPEYWQELTKKYDPVGEYKPIYEPFLEGKDAE
uniref:Chemosensory protein n=1 Tax=Leucinodes orbonalis TaxID=711050 RepID=A0AAU0QNY5_9NEOP|nr:chemosensory protein [Leucinodes orbonalis]